ncbi:hypothetical protein [Halorientalis pallida]|uniref:Uncharacterized protein n=1 Tax=Halorientalis pallida TaxID=2479928 RepID=A0A498KTQ8_9EURY|nr:hypothetical protein [Halorientalis pallida]RXK48342.1 hypothetical protein EAF64_11720 [Halorientalis pallida]
MKQKADASTGRMRARAWTIAAQFYDPADYGIPDLPEWVEGRDAEGRLVFADADSGEAFIRAENPAKVRR